MSECTGHRLGARCLLPVLALVLLGFAPSAFAGVRAADTSIVQMSEALDRMAAHHFQPEVRVAFGTFTYRHSGLGSSFSRLVEEILTQAIAGSRSVKLFARHAVQAMDPSYRELYREYFQTAEADALLYGYFLEEGSGAAVGAVRLHLEMTSLSTGELLGAEDLTIPAAALPAGVSLTPPALVQAQDLRNTLTHVLEASDGSLVVQAVSDRGDKPVYRAGEDLQLHIFLNRDAYLKVYHVDIAGRTQLIYPNRFHPDNMLPGGAFVRIPDPSDPFRFRLGPPFGTEFIKVIASTRQFADIESAFSPLEGTARQAVTRGLALQAVDAESTESLLAYTIVGK